MKIDSHHHIWDLSVRDQDWMVGEVFSPIRRNFLISDYKATCEPFGINYSVVVQTVTNYAETPELLDLASNDETVAGVVGWLDMSSVDAISHLDHYQSLPGSSYLKGIRDVVQDHPDSNYLARPQVDANLKELAKRCIAFDILTKSAELPGAIKLVKANPDAQFVLDHISKPPISKGEFEPWSTLIKEIASFENVVCKVSGMVTEADWSNWKSADIKPYFETILENFGSKRLMFGSDWPVCTLAASYEQVFKLSDEFTKNLSENEKGSFWFGCANRAYNLAL